MIPTSSVYDLVQDLAERRESSGGVEIQEVIREANKREGHPTGRTLAALDKLISRGELYAPELGRLKPT